MQRFLVAPGSTSGIEHAFSKFKRIMGEHWHGSVAAEERRLILQLVARDKTEPPKWVLGAACRIWAQCFGAPRASGPNRRPSLGTKMPVQLEKKRARAMQMPSSAAGWLAKRRKDVETRMSQKRKTPAHDAGAAWTLKHEEEAERQRNVRLHRACCAVEEGTADLSCLGANGKEKLQRFQALDKKSASA